MASKNEDVQVEHKRSRKSKTLQKKDQVHVQDENVGDKKRLDGVQQTRALELCGFFGPRKAEYEAWTSEFLHNTGSLDTTLSRPKFIADCTQRGFDPVWASAVFRGFDIDGSGGVNVSEYVLGRAALAYDPERDSGTPLVDLRLRVAFHFYNKKGNGVLEQDELIAMISDLASGERHVKYLLDRLYGNDDNKERSGITLEGFLGTALSTFHAVALSSRDLLHLPNRTPCRTVHEPRTVVAGVVNPYRGFITQSCPGGAAEPELRPSEEANEALILDANVCTEGNWRGALLSQDHETLNSATTIVENAKALTRILFDDRDPKHAVTDGNWMPHGKALYYLFGSNDKEEVLFKFSLIAKDVHRIVAAQPSLVRVRQPTKIFGDIHGQFRDMLALFGEFGFPSHRGGDVETVTYVFNGDFVDRGEHQMEVVALLFALKVCFPSRIFLLRGNHEFRTINKQMGEKGYFTQCSKFFDINDDDDDESTTQIEASDESTTAPSTSIALSVPEIPSSSLSFPTTFYDLSHYVFDWLPIASLVGRARKEAVLVLHGGIGNGTWKIEDLEHKVPRPLTSEMLAPRFVLDALWSDPSDSDENAKFGVHGSPRGEDIVEFGPDITCSFCMKNNIEMIVRSHQFVSHGYKIMHRGRLVTVFSARNYGNALKNDGAILLVAEDDDGNMRVRPKRLLHLE